MRRSQNHHRPLKLIASILCLAMAGIGWFSAGNTPRDGWSLVAIASGRAPMPGSGDRAYQFSSLSPVNMIPISVEGYEGSGSVIVRRDRRGLFIPSVEKLDLHLIHYQSQTRWASGTSDPAFHEILRTIRPAYARLAEQRGAWYQRIVDSIDAELAGGYPVRSIRWGFLAVDVLVLIAHLGFIYYLIHFLVWSTRSKSHAPEDALVLFERVP